MQRQAVPSKDTIANSGTEWYKAAVVSELFGCKATGSYKASAEKIEVTTSDAKVDEYDIVVMRSTKYLH